MSQPNVTIVVSPRERFSFTQQNLESIYAHTAIPFSLIYVDGGSPANIQRYLMAQAQVKGFKLIRTEQYLAPNQARNLAIPHVNTRYLLFIDNDVVVSPGWLDHLLQCAEETGAAIVCPLTCIGKELHQTIHLAGGEARILEEETEKGIKRKVHEKHYFVNRPVADVRDQLQRQQCEFAEFHCMLVQADVFRQVGLLDEGLLSTREHIDFCLSVTQAGGTVFCEPASVVTYVPELQFNLADLSFFLLRWSDAWEIASLEHFSHKWNLSQKDRYFKKRYERLGHRRHKAFLKPLLRRLTLGRHSPKLEQWAITIERSLNRWISDRHAKHLINSQIPHQVLNFERSEPVPEKVLSFEC
ncbi:glycosyltransferase family 2 protein [Leptothermofonsia sp. ETS-13]|uniref:glycosyltransferase family 2 protein n=1 Tax=Leptothermofonsia sp. ETS-13 TaxID=3035696 RepID=UPI003BA30DD8